MHGLPQILSLQVSISAQVPGLPLPWRSQLSNAVKKPSDIAESYHSGAGPPNNHLLPQPVEACSRRGPARGGWTPPGLAAGRASVPRPGQRSSLPESQRPATPRRATDPTSCGGRGQPPDSDSTSLPDPHHGGRSASQGRVPLPDPVGPALGLPVGQRSRETGERVRDDATTRRRDAFPGA